MSEETTVPKRSLGKTNIQVTPIGLGVKVLLTLNPSEIGTCVLMDYASQIYLPAAQR